MLLWDCLTSPEWPEALFPSARSAKRLRHSLESVDGEAFFSLHIYLLKSYGSLEHVSLQHLLSIFRVIYFIF